MNKFCKECGKEIDENIKVCPHCGYQEENALNKNVKKKKMPVWVIILIIVACLLPVIIVVLFVIGTYGLYNQKLNSTTSIVDNPIRLKGEAGYTEITVYEYEKKIDNNEHFVVVISREGCTYCELYAPIVENVAEDKNIPIYYIDIKYLTSDEYQILSNSNDYLRGNRWGTPTTLYLHGDQVMGYLSGYVLEDTLEDFLEQYFIME